MNEHPYWLDTIPPEIQISDFRNQILPARADVVVVGAGYTGLSAAAQLARAGAVVVVVEREAVGWGASSRNGGQVLTGLKVEAAELVSRFGETRARELFAIGSAAIARLEALIADESIDCEVRACRPPVRGV